MKHRWEVEFRKDKEKDLPRGFSAVAQTLKVVLYAENSGAALELALKAGGIATKANLCCIKTQFA